MESGHIIALLVTGIRVAFGTNLLVVPTTAMSGAWGHHRKGAVWWKAALILGGCGLVGAYGGATIKEN